LGSPENRLSRAQIEWKFRTYAKGRLSDAHVDDVIDAIVRLEHLVSVRMLMDMLRETPRTAGDHLPVANLARRPFVDR
jgi:hypothetical protein